MYKLLFVVVCIVPGERVKKMVCLLQRFNKIVFYKDVIVILIITKNFYPSIESKIAKKSLQLTINGFFDSLLYSA